MKDEKKLVVAHAPFWHDGSKISTKNYHIMLAALPAVLMGISQYGAPAVGVIALATACAMIWELIMNLAMRRQISIGDGSAAVTGLLLGMLMPATAPWWVVVLGTFLAIIVGKQIFGGIGFNPLNPPLLALAMLVMSFKGVFDFDEALLNYDLGFAMSYPLGQVKYFGTAAIDKFSLGDLFMGKQAGGIGSTFGLGLIVGGLYLILRGYIRWEISLSFLAGVFVTALLFNLSDPTKYASPVFHLLTGYTLIAAFFLVPEDSSSPVNFIPMLIFGALAGLMTVLIRNIGAYVDGIPFSILLMNLANPLLDKIRPKAIGKVVENA
ncbi:MAG: RnfABCDGE type electron transport complex subunit D [Deltaproteobacteria bacterium]|nr:RnfABCDGE type electron transport complex subunit D [Deltaproteobacteria bacterium]MBW2075149.1 RnfABCDGE type electron transport complex subunit D [Deltaproteobacteria bacterium]RLB81032.1 MAG: electron transporter RnfD [Deltaproteobacteria bacterium]